MKEMEKVTWSPTSMSSWTTGAAGFKVLISTELDLWNSAGYIMLFFFLGDWASFNNCLFADSTGKAIDACPLTNTAIDSKEYEGVAVAPRSPKKKTQSLRKDSESLRERGTGMEGIPCTFFSANF